MRGKKIVGLVLLIVGACAILFATYIDSQVAAGKVQLRNTQQGVDVGNSLFSTNKVTKQVGDPLTGVVQKKIDDGQVTVEQYERLSSGLKIGGGLSILAGIAVLIASFKKRRKN